MSAVRRGVHEAPGIGAIVMAAGAGRRMGAVPKALLLRDGEPLLVRQVRLAAAAGATHIVVVLGYHADRLARVLDQASACASNPCAGARFNRVVNPAPDEGTGSSLRCGLGALPTSLSTYLVLLGDQPLLEVDDVQSMLAAWWERLPCIQLVVPQHAGRLGHPVAFGPEVRGEVMHASGNRGVREWRLAHPERVLILSAEHARFTTDVDAPEDLDRLRVESGVQLAWPEP